MKQYLQKFSTETLAWPMWNWQIFYHNWRTSTVGLLAHDENGQRLVPHLQLASESVKPRQGTLQRFSKQQLASVAVGSLLLFTSVAPALQAGTITVTEPTIGGPNGCDLMEAIHAANNEQDNDCIGTDNDPSINDADTILFATSPGTISLTRSVSSINTPFHDNGLPVIISDIAINGSPGGITLTRASQDVFRILEVDGLGDRRGKLNLNHINIHNGAVNSPPIIPPSPYFTPMRYDYGGGLFIKDSAVVTITNCTIASNRAPGGGGIYVGDSSLLTVNNSTITLNKGIRSSRGGVSSGDGGGIFAHSSQVMVNSSTIDFNTTGRYGDGGGIYLNNSSQLTINQSAISFNKAGDFSGHGNGGGIYATDSSIVKIESSLIISNEANGAFTTGGGLHVSDFSPAMINNSNITSNTAYFGGGIAISASSVTVTNSSLLTNTAMMGSTLYNRSIYPILIENSCIVGNSNHAIHNHSKAMTITAQANWWGSSDGPSGVFSGSGDGVGSRVDTSNFLTEPILGCPAASPANTVAPDEDNVPTALDEHDEPFEGRIFLPVISR